MKHFLRGVGHLRWLRWGIRYRFWQLLRATPEAFVVPFYAARYRGTLDNFIDRAVYFWGAHERETLEYMGTWLTKDSVVLDIGANIGHHALYFALHAREVHAFEPNPAFAPRFHRFMEDNQLTNATLHSVGMGERDAAIEYFAPTGDNQGVGSFVPAHRPDIASLGMLTVVCGDDYIESLGLFRVDFIKIDVEGFEAVVLKGLQETLARFRPVVVMEYGAGDFDSPEAFAALTKGYRAYCIAVNRPRFYFFNQPRAVCTPFDPSRRKAEIILIPEEKIG